MAPAHLQGLGAKFLFEDMFLISFFGGGVDFGWGQVVAIGIGFRLVIMIRLVDGFPWSHLIRGFFIVLVIRIEEPMLGAEMAGDSLVLCHLEMIYKG